MRRLPIPLPVFAGAMPAQIKKVIANLPPGLVQELAATAANVRIVPARGSEFAMEIVDADAIAGAGVDARDPEPLPKGHPLWKFPDVIVTPHTSGGSDSLQASFDGLVKENIRRFDSGLPLLNVVDK